MELFRHVEIVLNGIFKDAAPILKDIEKKGKRSILSNMEGIAALIIRTHGWILAGNLHIGVSLGWRRRSLCVYKPKDRNN